METNQCKPVAVSRRIDAPASDIFKLLADPGRHPDFDGSGMLREGASSAPISGVGDVFLMKMHFPDMGDYEMDNHVVAYELDRRIAWDPALRHADTANAAFADGADGAEPARNGSRWMFDLTPEGPDATLVTETYDCSGSPDQVRDAVDNGNGWIETMTTTLQRLDQLCAAE